eukprot:g74396.t1
MTKSFVVDNVSIPAIDFIVRSTVREGERGKKMGVIFLYLYVTCNEVHAVLLSDLSNKITFWPCAIAWKMDPPPMAPSYAKPPPLAPPHAKPPPTPPRYKENAEPAPAAATSATHTATIHTVSQPE